MAETVQIQSDDTTAAPEGHDEAMINVADGVPQDPVPETEEKLFAGKYKSVEEMEKGYKELESKIGQTQEEETPVEEDNDLKIDTAEDTGDIDLQAMSKRYSESGELPTKDYEALEAVGINRDVVDQYIDGQNALAQAQFNSITSEVGGTEQYLDMTAWAETNLTDGEVDAFNRAVDGDINTARLAVQGLKAQFDQANGVEPTLTSGETGGSSADTYNSMAQLQNDMSKSLYKTDPAERQRVQNKLARSSIM